MQLFISFYIHRITPNSLLSHHLYLSTCRVPAFENLLMTNSILSSTTYLVLPFLSEESRSRHEDPFSRPIHIDHRSCHKCFCVSTGSRVNLFVLLLSDGVLSVRPGQYQKSRMAKARGVAGDSTPCTLLKSIQTNIFEKACV